MVFLYSHNRGKPIRVASIVVVDITTRIDIPTIISIRPIATTKSNILINLHPMYSYKMLAMFSVQYKKPL